MFIPFFIVLNIYFVRMEQIKSPARDGIFIADEFILKVNKSL